jgi:hypothetical protein
VYPDVELRHVIYPSEKLEDANLLSKAPYDFTKKSAQHMIEVGIEDAKDAVNRAKAQAIQFLDA